MRSAAAIGVATLVLSAGCGGDGVTSAQRERLAARLDQARTAAEAGDGDGVRRALASFRASVRGARERGELSPEDAERLLKTALQASRRARAEITPEPTPEPTPAPTADPAPAPAAPGPPAKPNGKGKGKGRDKGDEGDD